MNEHDFWNDKEKADEVIKEASSIKNTIEKSEFIELFEQTNRRGCHWQSVWKHLL